ncbi:MAG TPA: IS1595 family transposase [Acidobacteriaceae bacterium]|nr:IS1595 family transposase [Acidobacteriaceae bacterium]
MPEKEVKKYVDFMLGQAYSDLTMFSSLQMPHTLTDAIRHYSEPQKCIDAVAALRWPDGRIVCPKCNASDRKHYWLDTQKRWKCYSCRKQFSVKVGTIFEDSPLGLDVWLTGLWMICNCKNGVSSYEIARATGIAQKSAWHLLQRLRLVLKDVHAEKMGEDGSPVEVDEAFVGPTPKFMHASRRRKMNIKSGGYSTHKIAVMGMLDRETRQVRAKLIPDVTRETLQNEILNHIQAGATVYTDGATGYDNLKVRQFVHETVNHIDEYVRGQVHTQGIENFWSLLKRGLRGTYIAVEPFHLSKYVDEQVFRFNTRIGHTDGTRFQKALAQVAGKRLTWNDLTGKDDSLPEEAF